MNAFLTSHRQEFKTYLDNICSISSSTSPSPPIPPSYSTPLAILQRLPPTSREGFPSLPYLVDHARNFAALVDLWLDNTQSSAPNIQTTDGDLLKFHNLCVSLHERTHECLQRAEAAERPTSSLSVKWEELVEQLQGSASFEPSRGAATRNKAQHASSLSDVTGSAPTSPGNSNGTNMADDGESSEGTSTPITIKTSRSNKSRHGQTSSISASQSSLGSTSAPFLTNPFSRKEGKSPRQYAHMAGGSASASASASAAEEDEAEEADTPPGSSDGLHHFPTHPPFVYPHHATSPATHPSNSSSSFSTRHKPEANFPVSLSHIATQTGRAIVRRPGSAGGQSLEGSDAGSLDEHATALPVLDKEKEKDKERSRGLQKILPFKRRGRKEEKDREKELKGREKGKERERERERERGRDSRDRSRDGERGGSALGDYSMWGDEVMRGAQVLKSEK